MLPPFLSDLEWKITYVGSAEDEKYDQVLDSVMVGPVTTGSYRFVFQADPPDAAAFPVSDLLGVTVVLLTCSYSGNEFIRVGYYVNNAYVDEELQLDPPPVPQLNKIQRNILADKPRVTRFNIDWTGEQAVTNVENIHPADGAAVQGAMADCGTAPQQTGLGVIAPLGTDDMTMG